MKWLFKLLGKNEKKQRDNRPIDKQEQALFRVGREQFLRLKEKGLSIPIFTL